MSDRSLPVLPLAVLISLLALTFWLDRFVQTPGAKANSNMRHDPDLVVENFTATSLGVTGDVQYTVSAAKMLHFPDDDSSLLETVVFTALHANLPPIVARAPRGRLIGGAEEVILDGGVVVSSEKTATHQPLKLSTPTLSIFPDKDLARAAEGVRLEGPTSQLTANTMELNSLTRNIRLERARGTFQQAQGMKK